MQWQTSRFRIALDRPLVMGIVNVTPDSFSDGGRFVSTRTALQLRTAGPRGRGHPRHRRRIHASGHSSRVPGGRAGARASRGARGREIRRAPFGGHLQARADAGSARPGRGHHQRRLGAAAAGRWDVVAAHAACGVCLMHMHGEPQTMQRTPMEGDAVPRVRDFLNERSEALRQRGVSVSRIAWDPGIGFGKTVDQNFALLARQGSCCATAIRCWRAGRASRPWAPSPAPRCTSAASRRRRCSPWTGARDRARARREGTVAALQVWSATEAASGPAGNQT